MQKLMSSGSVSTNYSVNKTTVVVNSNYYTIFIVTQQWHEVGTFETEPRQTQKLWGWAEAESLKPSQAEADGHQGKAKARQAEKLPWVGAASNQDS